MIYRGVWVQSHCYFDRDIIKKKRDKTKWSNHVDQLYAMDGVEDNNPLKFTPFQTANNLSLAAPRKTLHRSSPRTHHMAFLLIK
jgi:hypothetical protein